MLVVISLIVIFFKAACQPLRQLRIVSPRQPAWASVQQCVHYGLMTAVAATSVASFEAVGSILVIAMLVAPGASAQLLTDKLSRMLWIAGFLSLISACGGYALAVKFAYLYRRHDCKCLARHVRAHRVLHPDTEQSRGCVRPKLCPRKHEPA
jgi:ABC-type Mn2+/Zn2+ transport system permease subunit